MIKSFVCRLHVCAFQYFNWLYWQSSQPEIAKYVNRGVQILALKHQQYFTRTNTLQRPKTISKSWKILLAHYYWLKILLNSWVFSCKCLRSTAFFVFNVGHSQTGCEKITKQKERFSSTKIFLLLSLGYRFKPNAFQHLESCASKIDYKGCIKHDLNLVAKTSGPLTKQVKRLHYILNFVAKFSISL